jgi:hypothetical protein
LLTLIVAIRHDGEAVGAHQRGVPRYWRAPIMVGDYRLRRPESVEQPDHVADEVRSVY